MLGLIEMEAETKKPYLESRQIMGGTFLALKLGKAADGPLFRCRIERWAGRMYDRGIRSAVFPTDFPYTALFVRRGILPVDPLPLRRALCASCVCRSLEMLGIRADRAVVAVAAQHMSRDVEETVRTFTMNYRYVLLSVRSGGEAFARNMLRRYGAALLMNPAKEQMERADALILFAPRPDLSRENRVLCDLCRGERITRGAMELKLDAAIMAQADPNCSQEQLAAALYSMGLLPPERLRCEITC